MQKVGAYIDRVPYFSYTLLAVLKPKSAWGAGGWSRKVNKLTVRSRSSGYLLTRKETTTWGTKNYSVDVNSPVLQSWNLFETSLVSNDVKKRVKVFLCSPFTTWLPLLFLFFVQGFFKASFILTFIWFVGHNLSSFIAATASQPDAAFRPKLLNIFEANKEWIMVSWPLKPRSFAQDTKGVN